MATKKETFTKEQYDVLPDSFKAVLKANGDKYEIEYETADEIKALQNALIRERQENGQFKSKALEFESYFLKLGVKPEEVEKLVEETKAAQEKALKQAGKWDDYKKQLVTELTTQFTEQQLKPLEAERDKYKRAAEDALIEAQLVTAIDKLNAKPGAAKAIVPIARQRVRIVEENGKLAARVYDGDNMRINVKGEPISFEDFLTKDFREDDVFGNLFNPNGNGGGGTQANGTQGQSGSQRTITRAEWEAMSAGESSKFFESGGKLVD